TFIADPHSFANPSEARVTHVALDLRPDFDTKVMHGTAVLTLEAKPDAQKVVLDTKGLTIDSVTDETGLPLENALGAADPLLGRALTVTLGPAVRTISIRYRT